MSEGPQYTNCTDKADWKSAIASVGVADIVAAVAAIVAFLAGFPAVGLIVAFASGAEIMRKVAEWQLYGKLICLKNVKRRVFDDPDPDRICVLGTVLDFERPDEGKSGFAAIDNDFGLNLFIAPFPIADIAVKNADAFRREMERSPQGDLIQDPDAPDPVAGDPDPGPGKLKRKDDPSQNFGSMPAGFNGYERGMMVSAKFAGLIPFNVFYDPHGLVTIDPIFKQMADDAYAAFLLEYQGPVIENGQPLSKAEKDAILAKAALDPLTDSHVAPRFYQAVDAAFHFTLQNARALHCEFEGTRIKDVYNALDFAHVHCDGDGFLGFVCDVLNLVIALLLGLPRLIAAAVAWASADDGKLSDAYDGADGEIRLTDSIVVRGRWTYDSAHTGYNELHAVRTVQKTPVAPWDPKNPASFIELIAFHDKWCRELSKVPPTPPDPRDPHTTPKSAGDIPMTPPQRATYDAQQRDENRWVYHPSIDGCVPAPSDPNHLH